MIAASVEDRVYYQKFKHSKLYPHLYVMMIGPSGLGKGTAIDMMLKVVENSLTVHKHPGRTTYAGLLDKLGKPFVNDYGEKEYREAKLWLIMEEMKADIGSNKKLTEEFIALMTALYTSSNGEYHESTRTHGDLCIKHPLVNWLAGTTEDWLRSVISKEELNSGFTARICFIFGDYDFNKRCPRIKYPDDFDAIFHHICCRLWMLQRTQGQMFITDAADIERDRWYITRPGPEEDLLAASWKRYDDLLLKFAMIMCLADGGPLVIQHKHVVQAKHMVKKLDEFNARLIETASATERTRPISDFERYIKRKGTVDHTTLVRYARSSRGLDAAAVRGIMQSLQGEGLITIGQEGRKTVYSWVVG